MKARPTAAPRRVAVGAGGHAADDRRRRAGPTRRGRAAARGRRASTWTSRRDEGLVRPRAQGLAPDEGRRLVQCDGEARGRPRTACRPARCPRPSAGSPSRRATSRGRGSRRAAGRGRPPRARGGRTAPRATRPARTAPIRARRRTRCAGRAPSPSRHRSAAPWRTGTRRRRATASVRPARSSRERGPVTASVPSPEVTSVTLVPASACRRSQWNGLRLGGGRRDDEELVRREPRDRGVELDPSQTVQHAGVRDRAGGPVELRGEDALHRLRARSAPARGTSRTRRGRTGRRPRAPRGARSPPRRTSSAGRRSSGRRAPRRAARTSWHAPSRPSRRSRRRPSASRSYRGTRRRPRAVSGCRNGQCMA